MEGRTCAICRFLQRCKYVTTKKLEEGDHCRDWQLPETAELEARRTIIREFGPTALRFILPQDNSARLRRR